MIGKEAPALDTYVGTWSLYTVVIAVVMVLISLVLMVVLLVLAMLGRFRQSPAGGDEAEPPEPVEEDAPEEESADFEQMSLVDDDYYTDPDDLYDGFGAAPTVAQTRADAKALADSFSAGAAHAAKPVKKRQPTGLWQLIAALLACVPALMSASWLDNIYGRLVAFTLGAGVNLLLLAAQIFLIIWMARLQRRR